MSTKIPKLTVITVNYESTKQLINLLNSLRYIDKIISRVIILDNNSKNIGLLKNNINKISIPPNKILLVENKENLGFSKAVNQGIRLTKDNHILLLNPDTELIDRSIISMFEYHVHNKKCTVVGGKMLQKNGTSLYLSANGDINFKTGLIEFTNLKKILPNNRTSKKFRPELINNSNQPYKVQGICGAFMLFRRKLKHRINLFNEKYFLYLEDVDFCINIQKKGGQIYFYPMSKIIHEGGSSNNSTYRILLKEWYKSRKVLFSQHINKFLFGILLIVFSVEEFALYCYHYLKNEPTE